MSNLNGKSSLNFYLNGSQRILIVFRFVLIEKEQLRRHRQTWSPVSFKRLCVGRRPLLTSFSAIERDCVLFFFPLSLLSSSKKNVWPAVQVRLHQHRCHRRLRCHAELLTSKAYTARPTGVHPCHPGVNFCPISYDLQQLSFSTHFSWVSFLSLTVCISTPFFTSCEYWSTLRN